MLLWLIASYYSFQKMMAIHTMSKALLSPCFTIARDQTVIKNANMHSYQLVEGKSPASRSE